MGVNVTEKKLQHFYIAEEQSIYLLSHKDAEKLKQWVDLCKLQLTELGYQNITLLGKESLEAGIGEWYDILLGMAEYHGSGDSLVLLVVVSFQI